MLAPDVVYSFTPPADGAYTLILTPADTSASGPDLALFINAGCVAPGFNGCLKGIDQGRRGAMEQITPTLTANTSYLIFVGGASLTQSIGAFTLEVDALP